MVRVGEMLLRQMAIPVVRQFTLVLGASRGDSFDIIAIDDFYAPNQPNGDGGTFRVLNQIEMLNLLNPLIVSV